MPDMFKILATWKKEIFFLTLLSALLAAAILFILPSKYLATSTALPASITSADRANVFNTNIQELYSALGNPDDLDVIVGTGHLDTIYLATAKELNLASHYKIAVGRKDELLKAARTLKSETSISKSEFGELKVKVWDTDNQFAPILANTIMGKLSTLHQELRNFSNKQFVLALQSAQSRIEHSLDSLDKIWLSSEKSVSEREASRLEKATLETQLMQYAKLITEYQLMIDSKPSALFIVERARPALRADKPERLLIIIATTVLGFIFAFLIALLLETRKKGN